MGRKSISNPEDLAQVNVRMTTDFKNACDERAKAEGISLNEWIRRAMQDRLKTGGNNTSSFSKKDVDSLLDLVMERVYHEFEERGYPFDPIDANDTKLRNTAVEYIANRTARQLGQKYTSCSVAIRRILYNGKPGVDEGFISLRVSDESGKILEVVERAVSSQEIDAEIAKSGMAISWMAKQDRGE